MVSDCNLSKDNTRVFLRDCMEGMREYPDKFFDLAIVDPPYTNKYDTMQTLNRDMKGKLAKVGEYHYNSLTNNKPSDDYFVELMRVSKNQIVWGGHYFVLPPTPCYIVWDKVNTGNFADCELAWTSFHASNKMFRFMWSGMMQGSLANGLVQEGNKNLNEKRIHPTQKPVQLYKWLLKNYAKESDKILDTHLGSGSSRIAAYDMGFDFTGYEIDLDYFAAQEKRFQQFKSQQKLFA